MEDFLHCKKKTQPRQNSRLDISGSSYITIFFIEFSSFDNKAFFHFKMQHTYVAYLNDG